MSERPAVPVHSRTVILDQQQEDDLGDHVEVAGWLVWREDTEMARAVARKKPGLKRLGKLAAQPSKEFGRSDISIGPTWM